MPALVRGTRGGRRDYREQNAPLSRRRCRQHQGVAPATARVSALHPRKAQARPASRHSPTMYISWVAMPALRVAGTTRVVARRGCAGFLSPMLSWCTAHLPRAEGATGSVHSTMSSSLSPCVPSALSVRAAWTAPRATSNRQAQRSLRRQRSRLERAECCRAAAWSARRAHKVQAEPGREARHGRHGAAQQPGSVDGRLAAHPVSHVAKAQPAGDQRQEEGAAGAPTGGWGRRHKLGEWPVALRGSTGGGSGARTLYLLSRVTCQARPQVRSNVEMTEPPGSVHAHLRPLASQPRETRRANVAGVLLSAHGPQHATGLWAGRRRQGPWR